MKTCSTAEHGPTAVRWCLRAAASARLPNDVILTARALRSAAVWQTGAPPGPSKAVA